MAARERRRGLATLHRWRSRLGALDLQGGAALLGRELAGAGLADALATGRPAEVFGWAELARAQAMLTRPAVLGDEDEGAWRDLRALGVALARAELDGRPTAELRQRRARLGGELRRRTWAAPGTGVAQRVASLSRVQAALDGAALVVYVESAGVLRALVATRSRARLVTLGPLAEAQEATARLRADLDVLAGGLPADLLALRRARAAGTGDAAALSGRVPRPDPRPGGGRSPRRRPDGWAAHRPVVGPAGEAHGRPVTVAVSASSWLDRSAARSPIDRACWSPGPERPAAEAEVVAISDLFSAARRPTSRLVGERATVDATRAALSGAGVVHAAAHGRHEADNPLFSSLELADGPLMGYDLLRLPHPPELVALRAATWACTTRVRATSRRHRERPARLRLAHGDRQRDARDRRRGAAPDGRPARPPARGARPAAALAAAGAADVTGFVCFGSG